MTTQDQKEKIEIPEEIVAACQKFASLAKELGFSEFSGKIQPHYTQGWLGSVSFSYDSGRDLTGDELTITCQCFLHTKVTSGNPA